MSGGPDHYKARPCNAALEQDKHMKKRNDSVMTIDELSVYLKIAKSTLYKLAQEGRLPAQKVGRHWRFHKVVIDRWLGDKQAKN